MTYKIKISVLFLFSLLSSLASAARTHNEITGLSYSPVSSKLELFSAVDSNSNVWVKGFIPDSLINIPTLFQLPSIHINDYELYVYQNGVLQRIKHNEDRNGKVIKSRYPIFYIEASNSEYYLNIKQQSTQTLDILIKEFGEFGQLASLNIMQISLYYGLAIMSVIFNVVFYTIFRDPRFILYSLLQLCIFSTFAYEDGMFYYFSGHKWNLPYFLIWVVPICSTLAALFTYYFLNLKQNMPYFFKLAIPVIISLFIFASLYSFSDHPILYTLNILSWYLLPIICFYQAIRMFKYDPYARFLIINFGILVLVAAGYTLHRNYDADLFSFFNITTLRLASAIEIVAISFALIFKVRTLQEENARYKVELRHYLDLLSLNREIKKEKLQLAGDIPAYAFQASNQDSHQLLIEELKENYQLTERETEVLICIWDGDSNKEISEKLHISVNTTKFHISRLYAKLEVSNRSQARALKEESTRLTAPFHL